MDIYNYALNSGFQDRDNERGDGCSSSDYQSCSEYDIQQRNHKMNGYDNTFNAMSCVDNKNAAVLCINDDEGDLIESIGSSLVNTNENTNYTHNYVDNAAAVDFAGSDKSFRNTNAHPNSLGNTMFPTMPLPLAPSFQKRQTSVTSIATSCTSNSVTSSNNYEENYQQQRSDSPPALIGMVPIEEHTKAEPNGFSSRSSSLMPSRLLSSLRELTSSGPPTNSINMDFLPTPINRNDVRKDKSQQLQDTKAVDELLAYELNKLSFKERESINEEIHGIGVRNAGVDETPELLQSSFRQLETELLNLRSEYAAFDRSQRLYWDTTYLNTEDFRIMFLRCDLFDCRKAATRLCKYATLMQEIYGDFALQRRPCLTDMNALELEVLESGVYQILAGRDRAGRRILINIAYDGPSGFDVQSRLRVSTYIVMSVLEDVETQRKGLVGISWWYNVSVDDFIIRGKVHKRIDCVPMRMGAMHCCIPSEPKSARTSKKSKNINRLSSGMTQIVKAMYVLSVGPEVRPHVRIHSCSVVECIYALQSFGIHSDQIPVNSSSEKLKTKQHSKWLELCRLKETCRDNCRRKFDSIIVCPNLTDVLFGRGRPIMRHPGNAVLRSVVQSRLEEYINAKTKKETTDVTWSVVRILKGKYGARFLKEENIESNGLGWVEVSNETARQKVRIAFRDLRTRMTKTNKANVKSSEIHLLNETSNSDGKRKSTLQLPDFETSGDGNFSQETSSESRSGLQVKEIDSSTSTFLGMDGTNMKRQRLNECFDCGDRE